jgi:hypothetical protein
MLYNGKIIYFTKALLPEESDSLIIGFSKYQMEWCKANEEKMWTYLVENKKLFSTDLLTISKFVNPAPFTKDFTNQSPGRAAVWIGYQIINRYMAKNSEVTLQQLMLDKNYKEILRKSKYRP